MSAYVEGSLSSSKREALAEMHIVELLHSLARNTCDTIREVDVLLNDLSEGKVEIIKAKHPRVRNFKNMSEEMKSRILEYIVRVSPSLINKDIYIKIAYDLEKVAQLMNGITHRLLILASRNLLPTQRIGRNMSDFMKTLIEEFEILRKAILMITVNPRKTIDDCKSVFKIEDELDDRYRALEVELYETQQDNLLLVMLLKEIIEMMEDSADLTKDAAEHLMYIAMHKLP